MLVHIADTRKMCEEVMKDCKLKGSRIELRYIAREKVKGVPHHAKAGNLNNVLMNCGTKGDFVVVFDCDMICDRAFIQALLPHFYRRVSTHRVHLAANLDGATA
eukprot:40596-Eustigmatos_ZCMA.PRE.1